MDLSNVNKKLFKYVIIAVCAFIGILLIFGLIKLITGGKLSYQKIEEKMKSAAISYLNDEDIDISLPTNDDILNIDVEDLVTNKNMKELSKYIKNDDIECKGHVTVRVQDDDYLYIPYLDCGDAYKTTTLTDYIINNVEIVSENDGLYNINNEYIYRGEYVNNYVKFANQTWRILKIDAEGNIRLIQEESILRNNWDNRYNIDFKSTVGINDYAVSRVIQKLDDVYEEIFTDEEKMLIATKSLCIGKRYIADTTKDGSTECNELLEDQKIGLIQINEFLIASIDENCIKIRDGACQNYNYLSSYKDAWWSITANAAKTSNVYEITSNTTNTANASMSKIIRATIYLNKDVIYVDGDGTIDNPYVLK